MAFSSKISVEDIFENYCVRRAAIIRALTEDADEMYSRCDPEKEPLCLFGRSNGSWEVAEPPERVPPELPDPVLGINYARDEMNRADWLSMIAVYCDCWLLSVAHFLGHRLDRKERMRLFDMMNDQPTVFEVLAESRQDNPTTGRSSGKCRRSSKAKRRSSKRSNNARTGNKYKLPEESDKDEQNICGHCRKRYATDEFWICCDVCEKWYHGECVNVTPAEAEGIGKYACPYCKAKMGVQ